MFLEQSIPAVYGLLPEPVRFYLPIAMIFNGGWAVLETLDKLVLIWRFLLHSNSYSFTSSGRHCLVGYKIFIKKYFDKLEL